MKCVSGFAIPSVKWQYCVVHETGYHTDLGEYTTYGIQLTLPNDSKIVHDISTSRKTVEQMVALFNRCQLSPVHLYDVVTDMLP